MSRRLHILLLVTTSVTAKLKVDLPLCPTNDIQFFPQQLPMHCRMPRAATNPPFFPEVATFPLPFYNNSDNHPPFQPLSMPFAAPPSFGMPPMPFPGPMMPGPQALSGGMQMPAVMPPMGMPGPAAKLPVIVMPFYSQDPKNRTDATRRQFKNARKEEPECDSQDSENCPKRNTRRSRGRKNSKRKRSRKRSGRRRDYDRDDDSDSEDDDDDDRYRRRDRSRRRYERRGGTRRTNNARPELLTPVIQYMTKDGYVIYEKEISKNEARDWLNVKKSGPDRDKVTYTEVDDANEKDAEETSDHKVIKLKQNVENVQIKSPLKTQKFKKFPRKKPNQVQQD